MTEESACFINNDHSNVDVLLSEPLSATNFYFSFATLSFCINDDAKKNSRVKISARVIANEEIK